MKGLSQVLLKITQVVFSVTLLADRGHDQASVKVFGMNTEMLENYMDNA